MELATDLKWMARALAEAKTSMFLSTPNPRVGCVIVSAGGQLLGAGSTQMAGQAHAEIMALRDAESRGISVAGATAFVTLEPCAHFGRTGPCCDALVRAGIARVVASVADPNPLVAGRGFSRLREAGVEVQIGAGSDEARDLNIGFLSRMIRGTPWVRLKVASSLDGTTALNNGSSRWITSDRSRADGHAWRARACAVLTGVGTVLADNPQLNVRDVETPRQPHVVVVDSELRTPPDALLLQERRDCYIYTASRDRHKRSALEARGATIIFAPHSSGQVDLAAVLRDLGQRGINELHVEAGYRLNGALVRDRLVDELLVYMAPILLGRGLGMAHQEPLCNLADGLSLKFKSVDVLGADLRIVARVVGPHAFENVSEDSHRTLIAFDAIGKDGLG